MCLSTCASIPVSKRSEPLPLEVERLLLDVIRNGKLKLPLLPEVPRQVIALCHNADSNARALADLIQRDASMSGHLLRIANSPAYAPRSQVVSLQQAVARLGMSQVTEIAMMIALDVGIFDAKGFEKEVRHVHAHSVTAAFFAKEIARARRTNVEEAFLTGLVHDVAQPVLYQTLVQLVGETKVSADAVKQAVRAHHPTVGAMMVRAWSLPGHMAEAIEHHHTELPNNTGATGELAATLWLADALSHWSDQLEVDSASEVANPAPPPPDTPSGSGGALRAFCDTAAARTLNLYMDEMSALLAKREQVIAAARGVQ